MSGRSQDSHARSRRGNRSTTARRPAAVLCAAALAASVLGLTPTAPASGASGPGAPGSISASWGTGSGSRTLTVTWTAPGASNLEYQVLYRVDADTVFNPSPSYSPTGWLTPTGASTVTTTSRAIPGLASTDTYVVAVRARDRVTGMYGTWGISGLIEPTGTPARVSGITETARSANSLTLQWPKAASAAGGYDVRVSEDTSPRAWAAALSVSQPTGSGKTVSQAVPSANLPTGHSESKTYVAQVRSRSSSTGTCGTPSAKCSRWVNSASLAQLDISGLTAALMYRGSDPSYVRTRAADVDMQWDKSPVDGATYEVAFYYRDGNPDPAHNTVYNTGDTNSAMGSKPDSWLMDWQWWHLCSTHNDSVPSNVNSDLSSRGCADHADSTRDGYWAPQWWFGQSHWGAWEPLDETAAKCSTAGDTVCSKTFTDVTREYWPGKPMTAYVRVRAVKDGAKGPISEYSLRKPRITNPPYDTTESGDRKPLTATAPTGASFKVEWNRPFHGGSAITGYDLQLFDTSSPSTPEQEVTGTSATPHPSLQYRRSYTFTGLAAGTYYAKVRVVNGVGASDWAQSNNVTLSASGATKPPQPVLSVAPGEKGSGKLTLTGTLSDNGGAAITKWAYRAKTGNTYGGWTDIASSASSSLEHVISNLTNGTSYTYQVRARNSAGWSDGSADASGTPVALPGAPSSFWPEGEDCDGCMRLTGGAAASPALIRWEYAYWLDSGAEPSPLTWHRVPLSGSTTATVLRHFVTGLANDTFYRFTARAVSAAGPGPRISPIQEKPKAPSTKPKVDLSLSSSSITEGGTVTVTASFPKSALESYVSTADTVLTVSVAATSPATSSDYTLSATRTLTIPAYEEQSKGTVTIGTFADLIDDGDKTLTVSATVSNTSTLGVTAPDSETLTVRDDDTAALVRSETSLALTEGNSATYTLKLGSEPTAGVTVSLGATNSLSVAVSPASLSFTAQNWSTPQTVTVTANQDSNGTGGSFSISHSVTSTDTNYSALSTTVAVTVTDDDAPSAPAAPTWDPDGTSIELSWTAPSYLGSTGATIAGYEVRYRASGSSGNWTTVTPSPATSTTFTVTPPSATTVYDFQVRAKNNSNHWGPWSATTGAMAAAPDAPSSPSVTAGDGSLALSWTAPAKNGASVIFLYRTSWECGQTSSNYSQSNTTYTITGLTNGVQCEVWVEAIGVDASYQTVMYSPPSDRVTATPTAS